LLRIEYALVKRKLIAENSDYRKRLEQIVGEQAGEIRASEENFRNSLDNSPLGIRIVSADGKTTYANRALLDIYGYSSAAEIDSIPYSKLYSPETYAAHLERVRKGQMGEQIPSNYEIDIIRKLVKSVGLWLVGGKFCGMANIDSRCCIQDITEKKRTAKALQASYDKLDKNP